MTSPDASAPDPGTPDPGTPDASAPVPRTTARTVAAALCLLQALALAGFTVYYVVELSVGGGDDQVRVLTSAVLILVFAGGLAYLARLWWAGSTWATTPTVVWNVLLIPVAIGMAQSGQGLVCVLLVVVSLVSIGAAVAGGRDRPSV